MHNTSPWGVLGVNRDLSPEELRMVYKRLVKEHHPDRGGDPQRLREITLAYGMIRGKEAHYKAEQPHHVTIVYGTRHSYGAWYRQWRRLMRPRLAWHRGRSCVTLPLLVAAILPAVGIGVYPALTLACSAIIICTGKLRIIKY